MTTTIAQGPLHRHVRALLDWWNKPASEVDQLCKLAERCGALEERHACAKLVREKAHSIGAKADDVDDNEEEIRLKALAWQMEVMACEIEKRSNYK